MYSRFAGSGGYLPARVMTNAELESMVQTSDEWIRSRTGISQRHIAAKDETTCDLAEKAARSAIENAAVSTSDIDLIVLATTTADWVFPSTACLLQERLDIHGCPAFDVQAVCAGFVYAVDIADKFIRTGAAKCALVVGAETFSRIIDWTDRDTCVLFGDGAGAMILRASEKPGLHVSNLHADGKYKDLLCVPSGISTNYQDVLSAQAYTTMKGNEVFKWAVNQMGAVVQETLGDHGMTPDDIDWLVPHQANIRIINAAAKKFGIPMDKVIVTVERHGNTSAASIPLAFDEAVRDGRIKPGQKVAMMGFGGGFTWGSSLMTV